VALAFVRVAIDLRLEAAAVADGDVGVQRIEVVVAEATAQVVGVVQAVHTARELAEAGARMSSEALLAETRRKLVELFPWCDFSTARFHSFHINRAEAQQPDGKRPDTPSVLGAANLLYCWPTKLTLAPDLAQRVLQEIHVRGLQPGAAGPALQGLATPTVATAPWDTF
jgi:hypothetical protein